MKADRKSSLVPTNLPLPLDGFVGRGAEMKALTSLLAGNRLVTLVGLAGMGKTRLAIEAARESMESHPDGVWFVPLAAISEPGLVVKAVASTLVSPEPTRGGVYDGLIARIGDENLLVVLDNCEHVLVACAELAGALLQACPNLSILATSQERLTIAGERAFPLSGLALGGGGPESPDAGSSRPEAATAPAVQLFEERARARTPAFVVDAGNVAAVLEICVRLDCIPLAIELAAAQVVALSPAEISSHLNDRFTFLTGGNRAALPRHQTLKAAVDWSYDLLSEPEKALLRRLSVFAGGATLDAIEEVCTGGEVAAQDCLTLLTSLVSKSLVTVDHSMSPTRYRLLETIRFYGKDRLAAAGEVTALAARHVAWCVSLAETAEPALAGPDQQSWLRRLDADHDNLRAAMAWSLDQGPTQAALRLAGALTMFWRIRSHFGEGFDWLDRALAVSDDAPAGLRAKALWGKALLASMSADYPVAVPAAQASLDLWRSLEDQRGTARALLLLGTFPVVSDNLAVLQHAIALARHVGDGWCLAQALAVCGSIFSRTGDTATARAVLEEAVVAARAAGDEQSLSYALTALGHVALDQGDYGSAEDLLKEVLVSTRGAYEAAAARTGLARLALGAGDAGSARRWLAKATEDCRRTPSSHTVELEQVKGQLALAEGDLDAAEGHFNTSLADAATRGATSGPAFAGLGQVALARGDAASAQELMSRALELAPGKVNTASALHWLAEVARLQKDEARGAALHGQALELRLEIGDLPGVAASLEALAGVAARAGEAEKAARVFGAASALRGVNGYARPAQTADGYETDVAVARDALGGERFDASFAAGALLSPEAAIAYLAKGRGRRGPRAASGVASLTKAERRVADLAIQGLTNEEIATQLFVSINTVKSHLTRVFEKLSVSTRVELVKRFPDGKL